MIKTLLTSSGISLLRVAANCSAEGMDFQQRNFETISKIYNRTVYPASLAFLANGSAVVPKGLFNENVAGRISPVANFSKFFDPT